ncbi:MAG: hypothetical protein HGB12_00180 [Bacteroidetes bacterium]|nr:hypothetical protein [Bacteroidota bacterium]
MEVNNDLINKSNQYKFVYLKRLIIELRARQKEFYYSYEPPSEKHYLLHSCGKKILILKGAPRTAKTTSVLMDAAMIMKDEHPFITKYKNIPDLKKRCWVIATNFKKVQEVLLPMFLNVIPKVNIKNVWNDPRNNKYVIELNTGWHILFKSQEEKIGTITSADASIIIMDERVDSEDWREQIRSRVISTDGMLYFTMDSNEEDEWVHGLKQLSYSQLFHFELKDNAKNLPKEELDRLENELDDIAKEKLLYGNYANRDIVYIFKPDIWNESNYVEIQPKRFSIAYGELTPDEEGYIRMFKDVQSNVKYVVGFDPCGGGGRNSHGLHVFDEFGEQCLMMIDSKISYVNAPELFIMPILNYYNKALFVSENREHGRYVVNKMNDLGYYNLYSDQMWKPMESSKGVLKTQIEFGIITTEKSKKDMKNKTLDDIVNGKILLHDRLTKMQLEHFVEDYKDRDSQKLEPKMHGIKIMGEPDLKNSDDDLVMSLFFTDRALNHLGYLNNVIRQNRSKKPMMKTIDDLLNIKVIRQGGGGFYQSLGY